MGDIGEIEDIGVTFDAAGAGASGVTVPTGGMDGFAGAGLIVTGASDLFFGSIAQTRLHRMKRTIQQTTVMASKAKPQITR
jgi:hypothetical protein